MSFTLTRKTDYALVAMACLAQRADADPPVSARAIADEYSLPLALMMNVMKTLQRHGLIESQRGASGGYRLARSADAISLADVIGAIEGPVSVAVCCESSDHAASQEHSEDDAACLSCRLTERCPITGTMQQFNEMIVGFLRGTSLADVMSRRLKLSLHVEREDQTQQHNGRLLELRTSAGQAQASKFNKQPSAGE